MINYEFPLDSITRLSQAFGIMEANKAAYRIVDYSLSQSTLEQVFLKQIRPNDSDEVNAEDRVTFLKPHIGDYIVGYLALILAVILPGFHQIVLRNYWRGAKYFFSWNEVMCGWILDVFEMHVLIQRSVQEFGHLNLCQLCVCCCGSLCGFCCRFCRQCWFYLCCCCCCCTPPAWRTPPRDQQGGRGGAGGRRGQRS